MSASMSGSVAPKRQGFWDWRAACNFLFGGAGAGTLVYAAAVSSPSAGLNLLGLALVCCGLLCVWFEIGRPWRALNVFRHTRSSWMTREAIISLPLLGAGLGAAWYGGRWLSWITAALALAYVYSQARMLQGARGIPAWRHPRVVPLMIATCLAEGAGLGIAAQLLLDPATLPDWSALLLIGLVLIRELAFLAYLGGLGPVDAPARAREVLAQFARWLAALDVAAIIAAALGMIEPGQSWAVGVAGLLTAFAGGWFKFVLVTRAAYHQGLALSLTPVRGFGTTRPGARPGW
jgi:phenylacetyl-CoA:acceptor oxidoreductase subunit 2